MALIGAPLSLWVLCLGSGLACERVLGIRVRNALLLPLGLCVALVLIYPGYSAGAGDTLAVALLAVAAALGLLFAKEGIRARINPGWPGAAGLAVYILFMLPVIAYGHWTWSGYGFVNDTGFELLLAEHLKGFGATLGHIPQSSEREFVRVYLDNAYPLGTQSLLGTLSAATATDAAVLFQGFISSLAAFAAVALATLTYGLLSPRRAALVAVVAMAANLTYQYALQGGIKEIGLLAAVTAMMALAREAVTIAKPYAGAALVAIPAAAALAIYNAVALPYIGAIVLLLGLGLALNRRGLPRPAWIGPLASGAGIAALLAVPSLVTLSAFFSIAEAGQGAGGVGATQFGQLLRPLPLSQISGVWLSGEYRLPVGSSHHAGLVTAIAAGVILAAFVAGVVWALWRRHTGVLMAAGTVALVLLVVYPRVSPYAQGKLLAISSPAVVLVALVALLSMRRRFAATLGLCVVGLLSLAILVSDLLAYAHDTVAPTAQIEAIRETGDDFAGRGPVLWNEFQEYAKYFARAARISLPFEAITPEQVKLRHPTYFYGHYFDLDEELLSFVERYPVIVTRRSPAASRPPANYKLVYENRYYKGWERTSRPQVLAHLPLQGPYSSTGAVSCSALRSMIVAAPRGSHLVVAVPPEEAYLEAASQAGRAAGWRPEPMQTGALSTSPGGYVEGVLTVRRAGRYALWVQGDFPRKLYARVDGRTVGWVAGTNTPGQWLRATSLALGAGAYRVRLFTLPGHRSNLGPGEWGIGTIGAAALQREEPAQLRTVPLSHYRALCGTQADWVELVKP